MYTAVDYQWMGEALAEAQKALYLSNPNPRVGCVIVKDDKVTIEQLLKSKGASVASFTIYTVGEGIEKETVDFAAEVAAAAQPKA